MPASAHPEVAASRIMVHVLQLFALLAILASVSNAFEQNPTLLQKSEGLPHLVKRSPGIRRSAPLIAEKCGTPRVFVTVSPLITRFKSRRLEVSWEYEDGQPSDVVVLYDHAVTRTPSDGSPSPAPEDALRAAVKNGPLSVTPTKGTQSGWVPTKVYEAHTPSDQLDMVPRCHYFVTYERPVNDSHRDVLAVSCIGTRPTWMSDLREDIGSLQLQHVFFPGTHDSGANDESESHIGRIIGFDPITSYTKTQDEHVLGQLVWGARYLDIRPSYYPGKKDELWINHGLFKMEPMRVVLDDIVNFMNATGEIVILNFREFPHGFTTQTAHAKLVALLKTHLGQFSAKTHPKGWSATLNDVWAAAAVAPGGSGGRLIVSYDNQEARAAEPSFLWPRIPQVWGDEQSLADLDQFVQEQVNSPPSGAWALMAELTPSARYILLHLLGSLRDMADEVNRSVTHWAFDARGHAFNIVAVDFVRSTGIVDAAIFNNLLRGKGMSACDAYRQLVASF